MASSSTDPLIGRVLDGRYRVGPKIARGGMATVYEASDLRLDRTVAVKVMHDGLGDDAAFAARFVREAKSAAKLSHPHVVSVFDQGDDDGLLFLVMEYVAGHTLRAELRQRGRFAPRDALALMEPVLGALASAHRAGLVHRDVKPENVLLSDDGTVKVADFGLSRAIDAATQHTTGAALIGTVSYLAPELVESGQADARVDVYAAGVLLYELLTGVKPHQGDSPIQVAWKHVHEDVPAPSTLVPGLPPYVDALVARATARDRGARAADAGVLLHQVRRVRQALDHGLADDPELTADLTPTQRVVPSSPPLPAQREDDDEALLWQQVPAVAAAAVGPAVRSVADRPSYAAASGGPEATGSLLLERDPTPPGPTPRPPGPPVRRRRGRLALVLLLVLALGMGGAAWWFGVARYTATPSVLSLTAAQAEAKVESAGLGFEIVGRAYSETVRAGLVMRSDPPPGERILRDGTVGVTISRGPERYAVPAVAGASLDEAQQALLDAKLSFGDAVEVFHPRVPEGLVIRSDPPTGERVAPGTAVDLVVSLGPRPIPVPDVVGLRVGKALRVIERAKLTAETTEEFSDDIPRGVVISQAPADGTLTKGETVSLTVSKGPELIEVPAVKGQGVDSAIAELEALGFRVITEESSLYVGLQYVVSADPPAGSRVPKGSTITLFLV